MTWADLSGVLRERGLIKAGTGPGRGTGGRLRHRRGVRLPRPSNRARCLSRSRACRPTARCSRTRRSSAGRWPWSSEQPPPSSVSVPWVVVEDARLALALLADAFHHHPSGDLQVVGITGTNGKTTTAYLIAAIFEAARIRCGILGTVAHKIGGDVREATRTTPEAPEVQGLLRDMVTAGCGACAMEVSSHALSLRRVDGIRFAAGRVHEPDPRSSRLPLEHGEVLSGEAAPVRAAAARRAQPDQSRRSPGRFVDSRSPGARSPTRSTGPPTSRPARCRFRWKG